MISTKRMPISLFWKSIYLKCTQGGRGWGESHVFIMCAFISHATSFRRKALADSDCLLAGAAPAPAARASGTSSSETNQGMSAAAYAIGKQPSFFHYIYIYIYILFHFMLLRFYSQFKPSKFLSTSLAQGGFLCFIFYFIMYHNHPHCKHLLFNVHWFLRRDRAKIHFLLVDLNRASVIVCLGGWRFFAKNRLLLLLLQKQTFAHPNPMIPKCSCKFPSKIFPSAWQCNCMHGHAYSTFWSLDMSVGDHACWKDISSQISPKSAFRQFSRPFCNGSSETFHYYLQEF